jgi:hypothetical protein
MYGLPLEGEGEPDVTGLLLPSPLTIQLSQVPILTIFTQLVQLLYALQHHRCEGER